MQFVTTWHKFGYKYIHFSIDHVIIISVKSLVNAGNNRLCHFDTWDTGPTGPAGLDGETPTLAIGTVTTGDPGTEAAATITGTSPNFILNLTIPQGPTGPAA